MSKTDAGRAPAESPTKPPLLTVEYLRKIGGLVPEKPVRRDIQWAGETITVYVKVLGAGAKEQLLSYGPELQAGDERSQLALVLSKTIRFDPDGKEPMPFKIAYQLVEPLMAKFIDAVASANGGVTDGR